MNIEEIWAMDDKTNLTIELWSFIEKKCGYGDHMEALTHPERVLCIVSEMMGEVNNGGFYQYFSNSSGNLANELVDACIEVGAPITADICRKAVSVFGGPVPTDWDERNDFLDETMSEEAEALLEECDDAFYDGEENLTELLYQYALQHRGSFG